MTAISILRPLAASAANPLKTDTAPANSSPAPESAFRGQLHDAIQAWEKVGTKDAKPGGASDDDAREPAGKNEDHPQLPVLVAVVAVILPTPPPGSIGLPAIGLEPGSNSDGASNQTEAATNVEPAPEASASLSINPPAPPAEAAQPDPKADLAFAMRLMSLMPDRETAPKADGLKLTLPAPRPEVYPQVEPAPVELPHTAAEAPHLGLVPPAPPEAPSRSGPDRIATAVAQSAAPAIYRTAQQDSAAADSDPRRFDGGASEKEPAAQAPKPAPPAGRGDTPPEVELKPLRESGATPAPPNSGHREIPLPMPSPLQTAVVAASTVAASTAQTPAPTGSVPGAPPTAPAAVRNNPTSPVTDVSVLVPVPRADSAGEDRVAIRLVQKGAEIHVSVRTPDHQLSQTLGQDLGRLATGLDEAGFRTESWRPVVTGVAASSQSGASHESLQGSPNRDTPGSDARSGGREGRSPGEQKRRQPDERPRWVLELEQHKNQ